MAIPPFVPGSLNYNGARPSSEVASAIHKASAKTGVDFKYLVAQAGQESSFKADAKASSSSASGLYQFIESTWLTMIRDKGADYGLGDLASKIDSSGGAPRVADAATKREILSLRNDPTVSAAMAAEFAKSNQSQLERDLGRAVNATDLYMAHFLGANGASKFLSALDASPQKTGAELLPEAAAANRSVFYDKSGKALSVAQIYNHYASRFDDSLRDATSSNAVAAASPLGSASPVNAFQLTKQAIFQALAGQQLSPVTIEALLKLRVPDVLSQHGKTKV